jgi:hypothetical protein
MGLAWQQGPLAPGAIGRFLVPDPLPERLLFAEPLRRRMRVRFGGEWIADSEDVVLLHEPGHYPVAYFPAGAVTKAALAIAALEAGVPLDSTPDTGSLGEDLRAFQRTRAARINLPATRPIVSGLVAHAVADPDQAAAFIGWYLHRLEGVDVIIQRAIHRGELPPDVDFELVNDLLLGPLFTRAVVRGQPLAPELADQTVDIVLVALRAGGLRTSKKRK